MKKAKLSWFAQIDDRRAPNVKQYLRGLRNYSLLRQKITRPYNYHLFYISLATAFCISRYLQNMLRLEFDQREQPNLLVPKVIYQIRRQHYIYWEISRVARGLPKTFTYSNWDPKAKMMYHVDLEGKMIFEKLNLQEERIDLLENPLLGPLLRRKAKLVEDDLMTERANRLAIYYLNLHKRYDLDNYLQYKPINLMDWCRATYYLFMYHTGLADTYRNEQYVPKPDFFYNHERRLIAINFNNPDQGKISRNILTCLANDYQLLINWLS